MATSLRFFTDTGLTTEISEQSINHLVDGSSDPQDFTFYLGSNLSSIFQNLNDPGIDNLICQINNVTTLWQASSNYTSGETVRTTSKNGYKYKVQSITSGGLSGASEPVWPTTISSTVVDNQVTWVCESKLHESTEIKLALSLIGLDSAIAGASLILGTQIDGGVGNALPIFMRIDDATSILSNLTELELLVADIIETAM